ncbi:MAG: CHAD domain-containing protein [Archangiaceae bacterium]|nr:CHAD domain-containing protein [Archangiaceae bacterium]
MLNLAGETRALRRLVSRCRARGSADDVHELRATARRLEVYLRLLKWQVLRADLHRLIRALGPLRDCDVASQATLGLGFEQWLVARRAGELARMRAELGAPRVAALLTALDALPGLHLGTAKQVGRKLEVAAAERRGSGFEALHRSRRAARRARLARAWLGEDVTALKQRQQLMGVACDLSCLSRLLREFGDERSASVCDRGIERLVGCFS